MFLPGISSNRKCPATLTKSCWKPAQTKKNGLGKAAEYHDATNKESRVKTTPPFPSQSRNVCKNYDPRAVSTESVLIATSRYSLDCLHEVLLYTRKEAVNDGPHIGHDLQTVREHLRYWCLKSATNARGGAKGKGVGIPTS